MQLDFFIHLQKKEKHDGPGEIQGIHLAREHDSQVQKDDICIDKRQVARDGNERRHRHGAFHLQQAQRRNRGHFRHLHRLRPQRRLQMNTPTSNS